MTPSADPNPTPVAGHDPRDLLAAFTAFTQASQTLATSYRALEQEVARLRRALRSADRQRAAEADRLTALLEALPGGVVLLDDAGLITHANAAATRLLGQALTGCAWPTVRARAFATPDGGAGALELANGHRVALTQQPLHPGPGRVLLLSDVTEARRIDDLLARHRRLATMGEMAANLAHQIRTPLAAALLYAGNAARTELPAPQRDAQLGKAVGCLQDLERLIADMLQFARGATLAEQRFELVTLIDGLETALRPLLLPGQALEIDPAPADCRLAGNREALASALVNLGSNALHAAGPTAQVRIGCQVRRLQVEIRVSDNGPGVAEALRERIFEPFFTSRADGTGLGLAVARSIARAHQGDVLLVDGRAGQTAFALRLPLAAAAALDDSQDRTAA
jgi:two-component system sensor histidine kinase FlrB